MVLNRAGGAGSSRPPAISRPATGAPALRPCDDRGSQALEFAMTLPALSLLLLVLMHAGGVAADVLRVHQLARDAARAAVLDAPMPSGPDHDVTVVGPSRDGIITARVQLRSRWASPFGDDVQITATASMVDEP